MTPLKFRNTLVMQIDFVSLIQLSKTTLYFCRLRVKSHFSVLPLALPLRLTLALVTPNRVVSARGENIPL